MAATGNSHHRNAAGIPLTGTTPIPFDDYISGVESADILEKMIDDSSSGVDMPAAMILETVQGEGGLNVASKAWLQRIERICKEREILLIVDDIQAGCGRTGTFFSFEDAGIKPDIVTMSKSLSGFGLPFAVTMFRPELDHWKPGEHNGTFRGNNHAFTTAAKAIEIFWQDDTFAREVTRKAARLARGLQSIARSANRGLSLRGRGMMLGLECPDGDMASAISSACFKRKMIIETSGADGQVVKCLCPLTISDDELDLGIKTLQEATAEVISGYYQEAS